MDLGKSQRFCGSGDRDMPYYQIRIAIGSRFGRLLGMPLEFGVTTLLANDFHARADDGARSACRSARAFTSTGSCSAGPELAEDEKESV